MHPRAMPGRQLEDRRALRGVMHCTVHQMELASFPRDRRQDRLTDCLEAQVLVADNALNSSDAASEQVFQEGSPVAFRFAR
jgi:hypothetical protein